MRTAPIKRMIVGGLAAYALIFHALIMGVAGMPQTAAQSDLNAALQVICSPFAHPGDEAQPLPAGSGSDSKGLGASCALCGLGHACLGLPGEAIALGNTPPRQAVAFLPEREVSDRGRKLPGAKRARAPPATVV